MSHVESVGVHIVDLEALKAACQRLGIDFREGQKTYQAWAGKIPCDHAIHVEGIAYEIGVVPETGEVGVTNSWELKCDYFGEGQKLKERFCKLIKDGSYSRKVVKLMDAYSIEALKRKARLKGYRCVETQLADGRVRLEAYGAN
jgi:hypothetical protein